MMTVELDDLHLHVELIECCHCKHGLWFTFGFQQRLETDRTIFDCGN